MKFEKTKICHRYTTGLCVLTLGGSNGETVSTRHFSHYLSSKGPNKDLDTLVFLKVFNTQLPILVATEGDQTTTL